MTTTPAGRTLVINASVMLKWQLDNEEHSAQALALREDFVLHGAVAVVAPVLMA